MLNYEKRLVVVTYCILFEVLVQFDAEAPINHLGRFCCTCHARLRSIHKYRNPFHRQTFPMFIVKTLIENRLKTTTRILNTQIRGTRYFLHILAQVMPKYTEIFGMTFAKIGHIERLKISGTEMNQHSGKT